MDRTIAVGQSEKIEITVSIGQASGKYSRSIPVETNDRATPQTALVCAANIRTALTVSPPNLNLGPITRTAEPIHKTLTLTRGDGGPIRPKVVATGNEQIKAELREIEPETKYELDVTISPPWPNGPLRGGIMLETGLTQSPRETITVFGQVRARLAATPQRLMVMAPGTDLRAQLTWDENPGKVLEATVNDARLKADVQDNPSGQTVTLHVPEDFELSPGRVYTLHLTTDDKEVPTLDIPIYSGRPAVTPQAARQTIAPNPH